MAIHVARAGGWCVDARKQAETELRAAERAGPADGPQLVAPLMAYGDACFDAQDYREALVFFQRAAELHRDAFLNVSNDLEPRVRVRVDILRRAGESQLRLNEHEAAEGTFLKALAVARLGLKANSREVQSLRTGQTLAVARRLRYEQAEDLYDQLLAACLRTFGEDHLEVARVLREWVMLYAMFGRLADAEVEATWLLAVRRDVLPPNHPDVADALNRLASVYYEQGRFRDALPLLEEAMQVRLKAFGDGHPSVQLSTGNIESLREEIQDRP